VANYLENDIQNDDMFGSIEDRDLDVSDNVLDKKKTVVILDEDDDMTVQVFSTQIIHSEEDDKSQLNAS